MAITRTITVFNTQSNTPTSFTSDATTYGQIKSMIPGANDMKVVVRETKNTLEDNNAVLPEGDFTIFLFPEKVKSGFNFIDADDYGVQDEELARLIADASNNQVAAAAALDAKIEQVFAVLRNTGASLAQTPQQRQAIEAENARIMALAAEANAFSFNK